MKRAEISPILKKNDGMLNDSYRFISILCIFSKWFETIVAYHGIFQINLNDMLCVQRKKYGTEQVLIKLRFMEMCFR